MARKKVTKKVTLPKVTREDVDRLGFLRERMKKDRAEEAKLSKTFKEVLAVGKPFSGLKFVAEVEVARNKIIDKEEVLEKIGEEKYIELSSITQKALGTVLGMDEIDEVTSGFEETLKLKVNPKK